MRILAGILDKVGLGSDFASKIAPAFEKAGLKNVTVQRVELPAGKRLGDEQAARLSVDPFKITIPSITQAAKGEFPLRVVINRIANCSRTGCRASCVCIRGAGGAFRERGAGPGNVLYVFYCAGPKVGIGNIFYGLRIIQLPDEN